MALRRLRSPFKFVRKFKMGKYSKEQAISIVVACAEKYRDELINRSLLVVHADKHNNVGCVELSFDASNFNHLTGLKANAMSATDFYYRCLSHRLTVKDFEFADNRTTELKLDVLKSFMTKNMSAHMIGDCDSFKPKLYTEKLVGGQNACIGFVRNSSDKRYVPNTLLKCDIRDVSSSTRRVIAVFRKLKQECAYNEITYRAKKFDWDGVSFPTEYTYLRGLIKT